METRRWISLLMLLILSLGACNPKDGNGKPEDPLDDIRTVAARTIEALTTQILETSQAGSTEHPPEPTPAQSETPIPGENAFLPSPEVPTAEFGQTPLPSQPAPTSSSEGKPCDLAAFVSETLPDGSQLYPGTMFGKTWTLRNEGSCTWTKDYAVVFMSGDSMSAPAVSHFTEKDIAPGETVQIAMPLIAPLHGGAFRADFKLRNAAGVLFAFKKPEQTFWVDIEVVEGQIHLANSYCGAQWSTPNGPLHCPGLPTDSDGYVYSDNAPKLENGAIDDEPTLWIGTGSQQDDYVMGIYPAMHIPYNAQFSAVLGCAYDFQNCRVKFVLAYQEGDSPIQQLGSWDEEYDGALQRIGLDLSDLGGRTVKIILIVRSMDSSVDGRIHLLAPVIKP